MDYKVPKITINYQNKDIAGVLLDGGSGVNILSKFMYKKLKCPALEDAPFQLKMADQRRVQPLGILRMQEHYSRAGLTFHVSFVVLEMGENDGPFPFC